MKWPVQAEYTFSLAPYAFSSWDPFNRILVAQAIVEDLTLLTTNKMLTRYDVASLHV